MKNKIANDNRDGNQPNGDQPKKYKHVKAKDMKVKKPWYKRWWVWLIIAYVVIMLAASAQVNSSGHKPAATSQQSSSFDFGKWWKQQQKKHEQEKREKEERKRKEEQKRQEQQKQKEAKQRKEQEEKKKRQQAQAGWEKLKGKKAVDAINELQKQGALGKVQVNGFDDKDYKEDVISSDKPDNHWIVIKVDASNPKKVNITVDSQKILESKNQDQIKKNLENKLGHFEAEDACEERGKQEYEYGFKTHWILGTIQYWTPKDANTWYYKGYVDVTNKYGATAKQTMECEVTGTNNSPQVTRFDVY